MRILVEEWGKKGELRCIPEKLLYGGEAFIRHDAHLGRAFFGVVDGAARVQGDMEDAVG